MRETGERRETMERGMEKLRSVLARREMLLAAILLLFLIARVI